MWILVAKQLLTMMIIVVLGYIFARLTKVGDKEQKFLSRLLLYFINPCLVISSFNVDFSLEKLKGLGFVALLGLILHAVMIGVAVLCTSTKNDEEKDINKLERVGIVFTNCGFVGIPLIRGVFGDEGVFLLMGYLVMFNIFLWTYGYYQVSGSISIKKIVTNSNIIGVFFGLIIFCLPVKLPAVIAKPVSMIGDLNTATAMILIGVLFADFKKPDSWNFFFKVAKCTFIRLVLCAAINLAVLFVIYKIAGGFFDCRLMIFVAYICSMCPCATSVPSLACLYNKDTSYASLIVSISSIFCVITVPAFVAVGELILK